MYAIIQSGGKQHRVEKDAVIDIELIDAKQGDSVEFRDILFVNDENKSIIGTPTVTNWCVYGKLVKEFKGPKVIAFKYKKRKGYRRKVGHRQKYAQIMITDIKEI